MNEQAVKIGAVTSRNDVAACRSSQGRPDRLATSDGRLPGRWTQDTIETGACVRAAATVPKPWYGMARIIRDFRRRSMHRRTFVRLLAAAAPLRRQVSTPLQEVRPLATGGDGEIRTDSRRSSVVSAYTPAATPGMPGPYPGPRRRGDVGQVRRHRHRHGQRRGRARDDGAAACATLTGAGTHRRRLAPLLRARPTSSASR